MNRVLHVDDEDDIREVAVVALRDVGGFEVSSVSSGEEAIRQAQSFSPDVILLDVMMPKMDGPATLRELKKIPSAASVPVIFMTAKVQNHEVEKYLQMGAVAVIPKPFDPMTLAEQVRQICQENRAG